MRDLVERFLEHLQGVRSARTVTTYKAILIAFFGFLGTTAPKRSLVEAFLARPRKDGARRAVTARNQALAALRVFFRWAHREGVSTTHPTDGICFLREPDRDPAVLTAFEVRRLFGDVAARGGRRAARDLAILALLSQLGLRVSELVGLDAAQIDVPSATLVAVRGKNESSHDLPLNERTVRLLEHWLAERGQRAAPDEPALFVSRRGRRLGARDVQRLLEGLRVRIGTAKRLTPHTLRHSAATLALTMGVDLATVGELLRHESLNTTRKYLHLVDERRREAVRKLMVTIPPDLVPAAPTTPPTSPNMGAENEADVDCPLETAGSHDLLDADGHFGDAPEHDPARSPRPVPARRAPRRRLAQVDGPRGRRAPARAICQALFGACTGLGLTCFAPAPALAVVARREPS